MKTLTNAQNEVKPTAPQLDEARPAIGRPAPEWPEWVVHCVPADADPEEVVDLAALARPSTDPADDVLVGERGDASPIPTPDEDDGESVDLADLEALARRPRPC